MKKSVMDKYRNHLMSYDDLMQLYKEIGVEWSIDKFLREIGLDIKGLKELRINGNKIRILRWNFKEIEEIAKKIKAELLQEHSHNELIDYHEFQILYKEYAEYLSEEEFAMSIGSSAESLKNMKRNGAKIKILKTDKEELKQCEEEIEKKLRCQGYAYKKISYKEFLSLYEEYKNIMSEKEFAEILGITSVQRSKIKRDGGTVTIFTLSKDELSKLREEIIGFIIRNGYENKKVSFQDILNIHSNFKSYVDLEKFAQLINIDINQLQAMKLNERKEITIYRSENNKNGEGLKTKRRKKAKDVKGLITREYEPLDYTPMMYLRILVENGMERNAALKSVMIKFKLNKEQLKNLLDAELRKKEQAILNHPFFVFGRCSH